MSKYDSPLNNIKIASPCSANWNEMYGNDRKRFCGDCKLNVYNLSGMTSYDAENLLRNSEGRMCVRYFRRSDGTILTADCPVGWAKVKKQLSIYVSAVFSLMISIMTGLFFVSMFSKPLTQPLMGSVAVSPAEDLPDGRVQVMGDISPDHLEEKGMALIGKARIVN